MNKTQYLLIYGFNELSHIVCTVNEETCSRIGWKTYTQNVQIIHHLWKNEGRNFGKENEKIFTQYNPNNSMWYKPERKENTVKNESQSAKCDGQMDENQDFVDFTCRKSPATILKPPFGLAFVGLTSGN